jgi:hypothetical protein
MRLSSLAAAALTLLLLSAPEFSRAQPAGGAAAAAVVVSYKITNVASRAYVFDGPGVPDATQENPELTLQRGGEYEFVVDAANHPFELFYLCLFF